MNNKSNTTCWEVGDIVIHEHDEKSEEMLMRVTETGCEFGMTRTEYVNEPPAQYLNDLKHLLNPRLFDIDMSDSMPTDIYRRAISTWGTDVQRSIFVEEAAEAIVAMSHFRRGKCSLDDVVGEFADLQIMLNQMKEMYGKGIFDKIFAQKLRRLKTKLDRLDEI